MLKNPGLTGPDQTAELERFIKEFPYCQTAHLLYVKNLHEQGSLLFSNQLKTAAIYAGNRKVLYELINGKPERANNVTAVVSEASEQVAKPVAKQEEKPVVKHEEKTVVKEEKPVAKSESKQEAVSPKPVEVKKEVQEEKVNAAEEEAKKKEILRARLEEIERERAKSERAESERKEKERAEKERVESEKAESERERERENEPQSILPTEMEKTFIAEAVNSAMSIAYSEKLEREEQEAKETTSEKAEVKPEQAQETPKPLEQSPAEVQASAPEIVKPAADEKHSFTDWLKRMKGQTVDTSESVQTPAAEKIIPEAEKITPEKKEEKEAEAEEPVEKAKSAKFDLIDRFIALEPRISPPKKAEFFSPSKTAKQSITEDEEMVTETLAKIYALQGNHHKAIRAYETLSLKFPEKSAYFAARISEVKKNIPNNK